MRLTPFPYSENTDAERLLLKLIKESKMGCLESAINGYELLAGVFAGIAEEAVENIAKIIQKIDKDS